MDKFPIPEGYHWDGTRLVMRTESDNGQVPMVKLIACVHEAELFEKFMVEWLHMKSQTMRLTELFKQHGITF